MKPGADRPRPPPQAVTKGTLDSLPKLPPIYDSFDGINSNAKQRNVQSQSARAGQLRPFLFPPSSSNLPGPATSRPIPLSNAPPATPSGSNNNTASGSRGSIGGDSFSRGHSRAGSTSSRGGIGSGGFLSSSSSSQSSSSSMSSLPHGQLHPLLQGSGGDGSGSTSRDSSPERSHRVGGGGAGGTIDEDDEEAANLNLPGVSARKMTKREQEETVRYYGLIQNATNKITDVIRELIPDDPSPLSLLRSLRQSAINSTQVGLGSGNADSSGSPLLAGAGAGGAGGAMSGASRLDAVLLATLAKNKLGGGGGGGLGDGATGDGGGGDDDQESAVKAQERVNSLLDAVAKSERGQVLEEIGEYYKKKQKQESIDLKRLEALEAALQERESVIESQLDTIAGAVNEDHTKQSKKMAAHSDKLATLIRRLHEDELKAAAMKEALAGKRGAGAGGAAGGAAAAAVAAAAAGKNLSQTGLMDVHNLRLQLQVAEVKILDMTEQLKKAGLLPNTSAADSAASAAGGSSTASTRMVALIDELQKRLSTSEDKHRLAQEEIKRLNIRLQSLSKLGDSDIVKELEKEQKLQHERTLQLDALALQLEADRRMLGGETAKQAAMTKQLKLRIDMMKADAVTLQHNWDEEKVQVAKAKKLIKALEGKIRELSQAKDDANAFTLAAQQEAEAALAAEAVSEFKVKADALQQEVAQLKTEKESLLEQLEDKNKIITAAAAAAVLDPSPLAASASNTEGGSARVGGGDAANEGKTGGKSTQSLSSKPSRASGNGPKGAAAAGANAGAKGKKPAGKDGAAAVGGGATSAELEEANNRFAKLAESMESALNREKALQEQVFKLQASLRSKEKDLKDKDKESGEKEKERARADKENVKNSTTLAVTTKKLADAEVENKSLNAKVLHMANELVDVKAKLDKALRAASMNASKAAIAATASTLSQGTGGLASSPTSAARKVGGAAVAASGSGAAAGEDGAAGSSAGGEGGASGGSDVLVEEEDNRLVDNAVASDLVEITKKPARSSMKLAPGRLSVTRSNQHSQQQQQQQQQDVLDNAVIVPVHDELSEELGAKMEAIAANQALLLQLQQSQQQSKDGQALNPEKIASDFEQVKAMLNRYTTEKANLQQRLASALNQLSIAKKQQAGEIKSMEDAVASDDRVVEDDVGGGSGGAGGDGSSLDDDDNAVENMGADDNEDATINSSNTNRARKLAIKKLQRENKELRRRLAALEEAADVPGSAESKAPDNDSTLLREELRQLKWLLEHKDDELSNAAKSLQAAEIKFSELMAKYEELLRKFAKFDSLQRAGYLVDGDDELLPSNDQLIRHLDSVSQSAAAGVIGNDAVDKSVILVQQAVAEAQRREDAKAKQSIMKPFPMRGLKRDTSSRATKTRTPSPGPGPGTSPPSLNSSGDSDGTSSPTLPFHGSGSSNGGSGVTASPSIVPRGTLVMRHASMSSPDSQMFVEQFRSLANNNTNATGAGGRDGDGEVQLTPLGHVLSASPPVPRNGSLRASPSRMQRSLALPSSSPSIPLSASPQPSLGFKRSPLENYSGLHGGGEGSGGPSSYSTVLDMLSRTGAIQTNATSSSSSSSSSAPNASGLGSSSNLNSTPKLGPAPLSVSSIFALRQLNQTQQGLFLGAGGAPTGFEAMGVSTGAESDVNRRGSGTSGWDVGQGGDGAGGTEGDGHGKGVNMYSLQLTDRYDK